MLFNFYFVLFCFVMKKRLSSYERGYGGTNWRYWRSIVPPNDCPITGMRWNPGFHLDHKLSKAKGGRDELSNFQWLSPRGHSIKTASVDGGFGNKIRTSANMPRFIKCGCNTNGLPLSPLHHWQKS